VKRDLDELWAGEWRQISPDKHAWLRNRDAEETVHVDQRWFAPRKRQWPLLCISVYTRYPLSPVGIRVAVSYKLSADAYFESDCSLPPALVSTLAQMLGGT
jgi:hypothetical protein